MPVSPSTDVDAELMGTKFIIRYNKAVDLVSIGLLPFLNSKKSVVDGLSVGM